MARTPIYSGSIAGAPSGDQQARGASRGPSLSIPNLVTVLRILLVPVVVWAIASGRMQLAFLLFFAAAISDAIDGFLAKRFGMKTELGAYLDPLADKVLIVSIYVTLGITGAIPLWIVILVVSRDFMIVGGIMLSWLVDRPVAIRPHLVSKFNTGVQIFLPCLVLASHGFGFQAEPVLTLVMALVAVLTLVSVGLYLADWVRHMNRAEPGS
jgi:cardiolipin synthase